MADNDANAGLSMPTRDGDWIDGRREKLGRIGLESLAWCSGLLALSTPVFRVEVHGRLGILLIVAALCELAHGFRRATTVDQRSAWGSGLITLAMGVLLINAPLLVGSALMVFLAVWFAVDGIRQIVGAVRGEAEKASAFGRAFRILGNLAMAALLLTVRGKLTPWVLAIVAAYRIFAVASRMASATIFTGRQSGEAVLANLDLADRPNLLALADRIAKEEVERSAIDRGWIIGFVATLFAIHIGRMGFDRTALGIVAPGVAVLGDMAFALLFAFVLVVPSSIAFRRLTRTVERRLWAWCDAVPAQEKGLGRRLAQTFLTGRLRRMIRLSQARYSMRTALSRGLQIGLPLAAIVAATVPVWGMSWYFDTENWAAGMWNSWAEERTDDWREAMIRAVAPLEKDKPPDARFAVAPPDLKAGEDFSFIVIGDTGEGDASQHILRAQLLEVVHRPEVKFVVLSSDVIYPTGAMRDYELKFWLPFMGTTKPVYAIPGNHDWYDALDGFAATFFEPASARLAIRARVAADRGISSTTEGRIEQLIGTATRLHREYGVPTQLQRAPFFQFQTRDFALFAVDTGVARRLDPLQLDWFKAALVSAAGKTKMAILGHPLYSGGHGQDEEGSEFAALHALLREHNVAIVMAGDTHDLENYVEPAVGSTGPTLHFVNGGGGAYLSFGTSLAWPTEPVTTEWAYYPAKAQVVDKIAATTPAWKRPAWWWTDRFGAWPFSAEWLSAAFDVNAAPFFQSFVEVRVETSQRRVRIIPFGIRGQLRWSDFDCAATTIPAGTARNALAEWSVPMAK